MPRPAGWTPAESRGEERAATAAAAGWDHLRGHAYLPSDFDDEVFSELWTVWEEPARSRAREADPPTRRRMTMDRYGLVPDPADPSRPVILQEWVFDPVFGWVAHRFDVADPKSPTWRVYSKGNGGGEYADVTTSILGAEQSGAAYPYRWADGTPFIPYVIKNTIKMVF